MQCHSDNVPQLYCVGSKVSIQPHTPQSPEEAISQVSYKAEEQLILQGSRASAVLDYPAPFQEPKGTRTPAGSATPQTLEIMQSISCGDQHGAQIVLCKTTIPRTHASNRTTTSSACFVAKIFDPLYYATPIKYGPWEPPMSLTRTANVQYTREAAAYAQIQKYKSSRPLRCTPDFYGCWSFQTQTSEELGSSTTSSSKSHTINKQRRVCLVLLEHIGGGSMDNVIIVGPNLIDPELFHKLDEQFRLNVWSQYLQAYAWLEHIGIQHRDYAFRNVMIDPLPSLNDKITAAHLSARVSIIDFNDSRVIQPDPTDWPSLPTSPIVTWWTDVYNELRRWCPRWWAKDLPRRRRWLLEQFGGDERFAKVEGFTEPDVLTEDDHDFLRALKASPGY